MTPQPSPLPQTSSRSAPHRVSHGVAASPIRPQIWKNKPIMGTEGYERQVRAIIAKLLGVDEDRVVPGARFVDDLGADSFDGVEIMMKIEEACDCEFLDDEVHQMNTVQDIISLVEKKIGSKLRPQNLNRAEPDN